MNAVYEQQVSDEPALRRQAREAIRSGKLPGRRPTGVWGGPGTGASCAVCGQSVGRGGLELELEFREAEAADSDIHHLHLRCFAAWELECQAFLPTAQDGGTISPRERDLQKNDGGPV
jgi:hypothetical protein